MTLTETRPRAVATGAVAASDLAPATDDGWVGTGDHKRLGLAFMAGGVISLLASCIAAAIFFLNDSSYLWTASGSRLAAATTSGALVIGIPALWIGLATYVMPLQIGATRLAFPRLHGFALWLYFAGGALVLVGHVADRAPLQSLASSVPAVAEPGAEAEPATLLIVVGLFVVTLAILLAAVSLVGTVLSRRTDGLRLVFLPSFSWSTLATGTVLVLATPVLLAGLALVFFDQRYGGTLFTNGRGAVRIWQHELWLIGQPFALLFAAAAVGIFSDVVATAAGRPLVGHPVARTAAVAAPLLTLLLWAGRTSTLVSPFGPVATLGGVLVGLPLVLGLATWLGTLKAGRPRANPGLPFLVAFLALVGLAAALSVAAIFIDVEGGQAEAFRNGQITLLSFGAPLLALAGAAAHWSPKLTGRATPTSQASLQALLLLGGAALMAAPGYLIGLGSDDGVTLVGLAGSAVTAAGVALFLVNLKPSARAGDSPDDKAEPYRGLTLEWATTSPPAPHNFDEVPEVRSPYPLADAGANA